MPRPQRQFSQEQLDEISNALKKCTNANEKLRSLILNIRATNGLEGLTSEMTGDGGSSSAKIVKTTHRTLSTFGLRGIFT